MRKSKKIDGHLVRVLEELFDNSKLFLAVACSLVMGDGITGHAVVDFAGAAIARNIGNPCNSSAILTPLGFVAERDVATSAILEVRRGVHALISTDAAAERTGGTAGRESNITGCPLLPAVLLPPLRGRRARAAHGVGADAVADYLGGTACTVALGHSEAVRAGKAAGIARGAYRKSIVRISALVPICVHQICKTGRCGGSTRNRYSRLRDHVTVLESLNPRCTQAGVDDTNRNGPNSRYIYCERLVY